MRLRWIPERVSGGHSTLFLALAATSFPWSPWRVTVGRYDLFPLIPTTFLVVPRNFFPDLGGVATKSLRNSLQRVSGDFRNILSGSLQYAFGVSGSFRGSPQCVSVGRYKVFFGIPVTRLPLFS